ncbi:MAG: hypothetical protein AAFX85_17200, partial [Pseudomonadota bacterium]
MPAPLLATATSRAARGLPRVVGAVCLFALGLAFADPVLARCVVTVQPGDNVRAAWNDAFAQGCSLHFSAGTHFTTNRLGASVSGLPDDPIEIYGDGMENTFLVRPNANQNIMDIGGSHLVIRDLDMSGGGRGLRLEGSTSDLVVERIALHDTQGTAFAANDLGAVYTRITIRRSEIYNASGLTGEGLYLGCNNDACEFSNSLVEFNYVHDTSATDPNQGDGLDLKGGAFGNVVRHNVFRNTQTLGIFAYANGGRAQNTIEANVIINTNGAGGLQVTGDALIQNNVIILAEHPDTPPEAGIIGHPSNQGVPNNLQFLHNTVVREGAVAGQRCMTARNWDAPGAANMVMANNAVYCGSGEAIFIQGNGAANTQ